MDERLSPNSDGELPLQSLDRITTVREILDTFPGTSRGFIRHGIEMDYIVARKSGKTWLIDMQSVVDFMELYSQYRLNNPKRKLYD